MTCQAAPKTSSLQQCILTVGLKPTVTLIRSWTHNLLVHSPATNSRSFSSWWSHVLVAESSLFQKVVNSIWTTEQKPQELPHLHLTTEKWAAGDDCSTWVKWIECSRWWRTKWLTWRRPGHMLSLKSKSETCLKRFFWVKKKLSR